MGRNGVRIASEGQKRHPREICVPSVDYPLPFINMRKMEYSIFLEIFRQHCVRIPPSVGVTSIKSMFF
jgi:hypothetical protein